jgi:hypothetical protein
MSMQIDGDRVKLDESLIKSAEMYNQPRRGLNGLQPFEVSQLGPVLQELEGLHNDPDLSKNAERVERYHTLAQEAFDQVICKDQSPDEVVQTQEKVNQRAREIAGIDEMGLDDNYEVER